MMVNWFSPGRAATSSATLVRAPCSSLAPWTKSLGFVQLHKYVKSVLLTGMPRPIRSVTRGSAQPTRRPTQLPKLKPARSRGTLGNAEGIQGFGGLIDNLVVQGATVKRVWVANHSRERGGGRGRWSPENGLQTANRTPQKETAGIVGNAHKRPGKVYLKGAGTRKAIGKWSSFTGGE